MDAVGIIKWPPCPSLAVRAQQRRRNVNWRPVTHHGGPNETFDASFQGFNRCYYYSICSIGKIFLWVLNPGIIREDPFAFMYSAFGHCPFGGGGLNAWPDGLGHLFREELYKFKWAFPCFLGGLNHCPDGLVIRVLKRHDLTKRQRLVLNNPRNRPSSSKYCFFSSFKKTCMRLFLYLARMWNM